MIALLRGYKMLKLYHYSNQNIKGYIKPGFFGLNHYSRESCRESSLARSFFYIGKGKEAFLSNCKFCYTAEIESSKIYDIVNDKKNLKRIYSNFNEILKAIKKLGYAGVSGNNGFKVICLFRAVKYIDKVLDKGF